MGRELQKKKRRSSIAKAVRKPKSQKQVLNNPVVAANWDPKQTLSQNYARLGLTTRLNKQTGGKENFDAKPNSASAVTSLAVHPSGRPSGTKRSKRSDTEGRADHDSAESSRAPQEIQVERDPRTGAIIRIIEPKLPSAAEATAARPSTAAEQRLRASGRKPLNGDDSGPVRETLDNDEEEEFAGFAGSHAPDGFIGAAALEETNPLIQELSRAALAARSQPKAKRKQSERERDWCSRMVAKHGSDATAMFLDRKMNILQLSEGQLKKKMKAYMDETKSR